MSENKRYTSQCTEDYNFSDILENGEWIGTCHVDCADDFKNILNELHEENEKLKQSQASTLREFIKGTKKIQKLAKENMELKSKLEYAEEVLNNIGYDLVYNETENRWVIE